MSECFSLEKMDGSARAGELKTLRGTVPTPFFMPVATKGVSKHLSTKDLVESGAKSIISNAFIMSLRPGLELIEKSGGVHRFMNYPHTVFTDCGGFQMISKGFSNDALHEGISFKSPFDGKQVLVTPESIMEIQSRLGSDVHMTLDDLAHYGEPRERFERALKNTHRWAAASVTAHTKHGKSKGQLVFGIYQGGTFDDLRVESAKFINSLDVDGVAIGGYCIGEPKEKMISGLKASLPCVDIDKPRYLMGVGSPVEIIKAVALGVDIFDSIYPTKSARHGKLFGSSGVVNINLAKYKNDLSSLDDDCSCYVCKHFTKAYLYHLKKNNEPTGYHYRSLHNIFWLQNFLREIRKAILEDRFETFKNQFLEKYEVRDEP